MNKLLATICCTLLVCACEAQTMRVWMKDGSERQFAVSEIESVTFSEEGTSMEQLKKEIEQFLDDWNDAMIAADTVRLGAMMDDGIILRHITGMTQTKQEWLEEVASGSMDYHEIENRDVSITFIDSQTADLAFTAVITATIWGSRGTWTLQSTMRLARRDGKWIRVNKDDTNAVRSVRASRSTPSAEYILSGTPATNKKGIVIRDNKKYVKK